MFKKILLAIDLEQLESSTTTFEVASDFAQQYGGEIWMLTVIQSPSSMIIPSLPDSVTKHVAHAAQEARDSLKEIVTSFFPEKVRCHIQVKHQSVYRQVLSTAGEIAADIIIIGSHHPDLGDYLLGSNSAKIARHADCSVLIVRE